LVQAIIETIRRERRVLVCAPSNTAVDLLTEKPAERGVNVIRMATGVGPAAAAHARCPDHEPLRATLSCAHAPNS
jgi:hypothetical protein